jgi:hypothetical protein
MTAALVLAHDIGRDCRVCAGDPHAVFSLMPWGFRDARFVRCPLCVREPAAWRVWREQLAPYLECETPEVIA